MPGLHKVPAILLAIMQLRPVGVYLVVSGLVYVAIGFGFCSLFSLLLLIFTRQQGSALPGSAALSTDPVFNAVTIAMSGAFGLLCVWAAETASGVWRLRRWALLSARVQAAGLACIGLVFLLATLLALQARHQHSPAGTASAHVLNVGIAIFAACSAFLLAFAVSLLVYLAGKTIRGLFAAPFSAAELMEDAKRSPFSLFLIAFHSLFSTLSYFWLVFIPVPLFLFGLAVNGVGARILDFTLAALDLAFAWGLFRYRTGLASALSAIRAS